MGGNARRVAQVSHSMSAVWVGVLAVVGTSES